MTTVLRFGAVLAALGRLLPAFGLGLAVAATHGIARFGYALLLPTMRTELGWTYLEASWMNTANALGYVLGALIGYRLLRSFTATRLFVTGLLVTVASLGMTGISGDFTWLFAIRLVGGLGSAWTFSCGGVLVADRFASQPAIRGTATGLYFGGAGIGMIVTAALVPAVLVGHPGEWEWAWVALGAVAAALAAWPILEAVWRPGVRTPHSYPEIPLEGARAAIVAYFVFAAGHTAYMFFVFAWLRANDVSWPMASGMWMLLGLGIILSPFIWQRALGRWAPLVVMAVSCMVTGAAGLLPLLDLSVATIATSVCLVGGAMFIVPAAMVLFAKEHLPTPAVAKGMMVYTTVFSVGQGVGSWASGVLADDHGLAVSLGAGGICCILAGAIALLGLPGRRRERRPMAALARNHSVAALESGPADSSNGQHDKLD